MDGGSGLADYYVVTPGYTPTAPESYHHSDQTSEIEARLLPIVFPRFRCMEQKSCEQTSPLRPVGRPQVGLDRDNVWLANTHKKFMIVTRIGNPGKPQNYCQELLVPRALRCSTWSYRWSPCPCDFSRTRLPHERAETFARHGSRHAVSRLPIILQGLPPCRFRFRMSAVAIGWPARWGAWPFGPRVFLPSRFPWFQEKFRARVRCADALHADAGHAVDRAIALADSAADAQIAIDVRLLNLNLLAVFPLDL